MKEVKPNKLGNYLIIGNLTNKYKLTKKIKEYNKYVIFFYF